MRRGGSRLGIWIAAAVIAVAVIAAVVILAGGLRRRPHGDTSRGIAYLEDLERASVDRVDSVLAERRAQKLEKERRERVEQLASGEVDVWSLFQDYVIVGDSRAVGFSVWDFLLEERVLADGGWTIRDLKEHIPDIQAINPSQIFLCFGLNDVGIEYWETAEEYAAEYRDVLEELQAALPNAKIYVNSILPELGYENERRKERIPLFSEAVRAMCKEAGYAFVDNDEIAEQYADLYDPEDGIHFRQEFYPIWAANMMTTVYNEASPEEFAETDEEATTETEGTEDTET